jgi:Ras-related protein Rab-2A
MSINFHYLLKFVIIGDSGVGKSNILLRYIYNSFSEEFKTTVGVEFGAKNIEIDKKVYRIQIWDTAGQENFRSIARAYYKNSVCACVVYDISKHSSFEDIQVWIDDCTKQTAKSVLLFLIGNKNDLNDEREVSYEEGEAYAKAHKMMFLEASAKTGNNINEIFERSVKQIAKNIKNNVYDLENDSSGIRIGVNSNNFILRNDDKEVKNKENPKKKCC